MDHPFRSEQDLTHCAICLGHVYCDILIMADRSSCVEPQPVSLLLAVIGTLLLAAIGTLLLLWTLPHT